MRDRYRGVVMAERGVERAVHLGREAAGDTRVQVTAAPRSGWRGGWRPDSTPHDLLLRQYRAAADGGVRHHPAMSSTAPALAR